MRGLFTAGILDVLMEHDVNFDGLVGTSAGAAFGCNYKSRQPGRALRYNKRFARDARYSGWWSWLTTGNVFNAEFCYHTVPRSYDYFDVEAFDANPMEFHVVCTDVTNGQAVYHRCDKANDECYEWIRASSSLPIVSRVVHVGGRQLLDGGMADNVALRYFQELGYARNVVILTRPATYVKQPLGYNGLVRLAMWRYPHVAHAMLTRHKVYRSQIAYVAAEEQAGRALVLRPDEELNIPHVCHDAEAMQRVYDVGRDMGLRRLNEIQAYLER